MRCLARLRATSLEDPAHKPKRLSQARLRTILRSQRVTLPRRAGVTLTCVEAYEVDAPVGVNHVIWLLVTNREAGDAHALIELVDWNRARREIDMFLNVLKSACRVEALQLSQMERVKKALVLYMLVLWRIARLMRGGRTSQKLDATLFFAAGEIHGAHILYKKAGPKKPPTLNQMIRMISSLGGFLGRKSDGEPGAKTRGLASSDSWML